MLLSTANILAEMPQRLIRDFAAEYIYLFGSHAWGQPHVDSNIDLMVIVHHSELDEYKRLVAGRRCLSDFHIAKDVIIKTEAEFNFFKAVPVALECKIAEQGKILYERS